MTHFGSSARSWPHFMRHLGTSRKPTPRTFGAVVRATGATSTIGTDRAGSGKVSTCSTAFSRINAAVSWSPSPSQRGWLRDAARQARRSRAADLCRTQSPTRSSAPAAATSASGGLTESFAGTAGDDWRSARGRIKLKRRGETEAGHAGKQPCPGITRWAHRVDEVGSVRAAWLDAPAPPSDPETSSNDRPPCLENPRPDEIGAEHSSLPKTATLHFTLNQDSSRPAAASTIARAGLMCRRGAPSEAPGTL